MASVLAHSNQHDQAFIHPPRVLAALIEKIVRRGSLSFFSSRTGQTLRFGDGTGPEVVIGVTAEGAAKIAANPDLALGEAYMDGTLAIISGDIRSFFDVIFRNQEAAAFSKTTAGTLKLRLLRAMQQANNRAASRRNVAHHYDLSTDLYRMFLDDDLQYSCAYFTRPDATLEDAQRAKKQHLIGKLLLEDGLSVLDIGCGWGGMALEIARAANVEVQGVTLSEDQLAIATQRGIGTKASFSLTDYRDVTGSFDRIISVGMFEHVGVPNYDEFFEKIAALLSDDGVAVIHSIGRKDGPDITNPWIAKYIFPGGYIPALSEVLPAIERSGLWVTDIEILRLHYAETLVHWFKRFAERREEIAALFDERFCRMWEFYLAASESAFRGQGHMNFQIQLAKRVDAVPLTRDYITDHDRMREDRDTSRLSANDRKLSLV
ncbi:methyltransferase domain-containing protein (plasmid) [Sphingobium yanoikuyae]|uniref:Methyltransferase domain-containing protein n=1 Tax=Sphingobium yanoikuyae TaxID=13690 RepID=A0A6P1GQA6_SPHYA|nr:cyclopropane-fatty-acyl-phospholipid synthase family protein [Sphingobium yanoikuyae]QHD70699.1 methyltransferase domain-containing protein [Sphingobium yanoikuyae]